MSQPTQKTLGDSAVRRARKELLGRDHVRPLTEFVRELREERGLGPEIPFFDPLDGGISARCLVIAEAPGPGAVRSGFVSRDNPDDSAKNTLLSHHEAGLRREATVLWNTVPWYIGSGDRIRPAERRDIEDGLPHLLRLVTLLPALKVVLLAGRKAQRIEDQLRSRFPWLRVFTAPHPSPMFVNRDPKNWSVLVDDLRKVSDALAGFTFPEPYVPRRGRRHSQNPPAGEVLTQAAGDDGLEPMSDEDLWCLARDRAVILPREDMQDREAVIAALRALPEPVRSASKFAGKRIVRAREYQKGGNPRQRGGHGYNAYELIPTGDFGIRFEDLLARIRRLPPKSSESYGAGGTNHIQWDLDRNHTYLIDDVPSRKPSPLDSPTGDTPASQSDAAPEIWTRVRLASGVELHVRADVEAAHGEEIRALTELARESLAP